MIEITVSSKAYTQEELMEKFKKYSEDPADFDEFIVAMMKTKQLVKRADGYYPTKTTATSEVKEVDQYRVYNAQKHGGVITSKKGKYQRIAISQKTWSKKTDPTDMYISSYYNKKTKKFEPIEERIPLISSDKPPVKPRKGERWRANIPADIVRKYRLKPDTPIRVRVRAVTPTYYGTLSLWGYKLGGMIGFGQTSKHQEDRKLELRAETFNLETNGNIREGITAAGDKIIKTIEEWLKIYDAQYYEFYNNCGNLITKEQPPHKGAYIEPITIPPGRQSSSIEFDDLDSNKPAVVYNGKLPYNWVEKNESNLAAAFYLIGQDYVVHGYKGRDRKFKKTIEGTKGKSATIKSESKPYSSRQTQLTFDNIPGFKRKK